MDLFLGARDATHNNRVSISVEELLNDLQYENSKYFQKRPIKIKIPTLYEPTCFVSAHRQMIDLIIQNIPARFGIFVLNIDIIHKRTIAWIDVEGVLYIFKNSPNVEKQLYQLKRLIELGVRIRGFPHDFIDSSNRSIKERLFSSAMFEINKRRNSLNTRVPSLKEFCRGIICSKILSVEKIGIERWRYERVINNLDIPSSVKLFLLFSKERGIQQSGVASLKNLSIRVIKSRLPSDTELYQHSLLKLTNLILKSSLVFSLRFFDEKHLHILSLKSLCKRTIRAHILRPETRRLCETPDPELYEKSIASLPLPIFFRNYLAVEDEPKITKEDDHYVRSILSIRNIPHPFTLDWFYNKTSVVKNSVLVLGPPPSRRRRRLAIDTTIQE